MRRLILTLLLALNSSSVFAAGQGFAARPSLSTALWLTGWGLVCFLGVACFMLYARLKQVRSKLVSPEELESHRKFMLAGISAPDALIMTDMDMRVEFVNRVWLDQAGFQDDIQVLGSHVDLFDCSCSQTPEELQALHEQLKRQGLVDVEIVCGEQVNRYTVSTILAQDGSPVGYLGVIRDISKQKQASWAVERAKERAETTAKTRSLILNNVTHEIRTPLNGVIGMLQILLMGDLSEEQVGQAKVAMDSAMKLTSIIDSIITYSELDSSNVVMEPQPFSLMNTMLGLLESHRVHADEKGLVLDMKARPGTQDGLIGDGRRIRQIVDILLGNAVKFTNEGHITVHLSTLPAGTEGKVRLKLVVEDTGVGIAEKQLPTVLSGFVQGDKSYSRRFGGLGLGLGMAKRLADVMSGTLEVASEEGVGTTLTLTVELDVLSDQQGGEAVVLAPMLPRGERPRVLLALAPGLDATTLKFYLECRGVEVLTVNGPRPALELLESTDCPVLDMVVFHLYGPAQTGVLEQLDDGQMKIPVILLGGDPGNTCFLELVVKCAGYPLVSVEVWNLLLETVAGPVTGQDQEC